MRVKSFREVWKQICPDIERPINSDFEVSGIDGSFHFCTVEFMRGPFGLQDGEERDQYFLWFSEPGKRDYMSIKIECKPLSNKYEITDYTRKKRKSESDYEAKKDFITAFLINSTVKIN